MGVAEKEMIISFLNIEEITKSLYQNDVLGKPCDAVSSILRHSDDWTEVKTDPRNGRILPNGYFTWIDDPKYTLVVPSNFENPSPLEVRTEFKYCVNIDSKGLPDIKTLSNPHATENYFHGRGMASKQVSNPSRCIFEPLVNLDVLFEVMRNSGANLDQVVERLVDKKIGFKKSMTGLDFAELESPISFNRKIRASGYLILNFREDKEMKVKVVYRPQV